MSCHRICRELLWLARFGEFPPDSAPHLDHLSGCRACRDEVGFDRAMVERLREALAARVADASPSATTWERIVARAQAPEPATVRLWEWSTALVARLRVATGVAFASLALILALNMQLVPAGVSPAGSTDAVGDSALLSGIRGTAPQFQAADDRTSSDPGGGIGPPISGTPPWEPFVPPAIGGPQTNATPEVEQAPVDEAPADTFVLVFDLIEQPAPAAQPAEEAEPEPDPAPTPVNPEPGEPS